LGDYAAQTCAQTNKSGGSGDGGDVFQVYLVKDAPEVLSDASLAVQTLSYIVISDLSLNVLSCVQINGI
jgi:hypothetical protein